MCTCNTSTWEVDAEEPNIEDQFGLHSETLSLQTKTNKHKQTKKKRTDYSREAKI
jgi:hypothetical protein